MFRVLFTMRPRGHAPDAKPYNTMGGKYDPPMPDLDARLLRFQRVAYFQCRALKVWIVPVTAEETAKGQ